MDVVVDFPFLNPCCLGDNILFCSKYLFNLVPIILSRIFPGKDKSDIGLSWKHI